MKYNFIEILISILDVFIFNNPIGITAVIVTLVIGLVLCRFTNLKVVIISICICFFMLALGVLVTLAGNTPDNLWMPIIFFPMFVVLVLVCAVYYTLKFIIKMFKK